MVVRVNWLFLFESISPGDFDRTVRDHFVDIHVAGRPRTRLKDINGEFGIKLSCDHFFRRRKHGFDLNCRQRILAGPRQLAEITIGHACSPFHQSHRPDHFRPKCPARDGKVINGSLRLRSVISIGGNLDITHGIMFGTKFGHQNSALSLK